MSDAQETDMLTRIRRGDYKIDGTTNRAEVLARFKHDSLRSANLLNHRRADDIYDYATSKTLGTFEEVARFLSELGALFG